MENNSLKLRHSANFHAALNKYRIERKNHLNKSDNKLRSIRKICKQSSGQWLLQWLLTAWADANYAHENKKNHNEEGHFSLPTVMNIQCYLLRAQNLSQ